MRHPDLDFHTQVALVGAIAITTAAILMRAGVVLRRQYAGIPHRYPRRWSQQQITLFERFRATIGVLVLMTWAVLQLSAPWMPESWPFNFEQTVFTVTIMLLTYAWILLLSPANWETGIFNKGTFRITVTALAFWWISLIGALLWAIGLAATRSTVFTIPLGVYA